MTVIEEESFGVVPLSEQKGEWKVFLILHKEGNHWGFPKGRKNPGETPIEAAAREVEEETGLKVVRFLKEIPFTETYKFRRRGTVISKSVHYFPALVSGEFIPQEEEIREGKWLSLKDAMNQLSFKEAKSVCKEVTNLLHQ
jgi:bis(5'-nucleosidyl)-tetraphosphatase